MCGNHPLILCLHRMPVFSAGQTSWNGKPVEAEAGVVEAVLGSAAPVTGPFLPRPSIKQCLSRPMDRVLHYLARPGLLGDSHATATLNISELQEHRANVWFIIVAGRLNFLQCCLFFLWLDFFFSSTEDRAF